MKMWLKQRKRYEHYLNIEFNILNMDQTTKV